MSKTQPRLLLIVALALGTSAWPSAAEQPARPGATQSAAANGLATTLEAHRWSLQSATDGQGRNIEALTLTPGHSFAFNFHGSRLNLEGGCNRLNGSYQITAEGQLKVGLLATTMMACEPALMQADAALSKLLTNPLKAELTQGAPPSLRLVSVTNETLLLTGQATPESLYGAPMLIFLEIAAQPVACKNPPAPSNACLQVRERHYDEQGLSVGKPGAWKPFSDSIEGYVHTPGQRNVLRVKRFNRGLATAGGSPFLYVLDLTIESEIVRQ